MAEPHSALGYAGALSSLGLFAGRVTGSVVGRPVELAAAEQELATARSRVACLTLEGEPGIGKTRILLAIEELARAQSFVSIAVTAEEEIRGPFLVARSIFASPADAAPQAPARLRPRSCRPPGDRGQATAGRHRRRPAVGGRRQPADAALRYSCRRRQPDLLRPRDARG